MIIIAMKSKETVKRLPISRVTVKSWMESLNNIFKIRVLFCTFIKITRELLKLFFFSGKIKKLERLRETFEKLRV